MGKIKEFIDQCSRVLKTTKKPNQQEFSTTAKIAGIGILLIGLIGFVIFLIKHLIFN